jgi:hypothetical protein
MVAHIEELIQQDPSPDNYLWVTSSRLLYPLLVNTEVLNGQKVLQSYQEQLQQTFLHQAVSAQHSSTLPAIFTNKKDYLFTKYGYFIAIGCLWLVLRKSVSYLESLKEGQVIELKKAYSKPFIFLALNLNLYYELRIENTDPEVIFVSLKSRYPRGGEAIATLLTHVWKFIRQNLSELQENRIANNQENALQSAALALITEGIIFPLHAQLETELKSPVSQRIDFATIVYLVLKAYLDKREDWISKWKEKGFIEETLLSHPLIACLKNYPASNGWSPLYQEKLNQRELALSSLFLLENDSAFSQTEYYALPKIRVEVEKNKKSALYCFHPKAVQQMRESHFLRVDGTIHSEKPKLPLVIPIDCLSSQDQLSYLLIIYPEMPGLEFAASELTALLVDKNPSLVEHALLIDAKYNRYPVTISYCAKGENLANLLTHMQHCQLPFNRKNYSQQAILAMLLNQSFAEPGNFLAQVSAVDYRVDLTCFSYPRSFYPPFYFDETHKKVLPLIRNSIFCFNAMHEEIDPKVYQQWLMLDPQLLLENWLKRVENFSQRLKIVFNERIVEEFFDNNRSYPESILRTIIPIDLLIRLSHQLNFIQKKLVENIKNPYLTHFTLFIDLEFSTAIYYQQLQQETALINARIQKVFSDSPTLRETLKILVDMPFTAKELLEKERKQNFIFLRENLQKTNESQRLWEDILNNITLANQLDEKKLTSWINLLRYQLENHLIELNFASIYSNNPQEKWGSFEKKLITLVEKLIESRLPFRRLAIHKCKVLTDKLLEKLLKNVQTLQELLLDSCEKLSNRAIDLIIRYVPMLKSLTLESLTLAEEKSLWSSLFSSKKNTTIPVIFHSLETLILNNCINLKSLQFSAPHLKQVVIHQCQHFDSPVLTIPLLSYFKKEFPKLSRLKMDNIKDKLSLLFNKKEIVLMVWLAHLYGEHPLHEIAPEMAAFLGLHYEYGIEVAVNTTQALSYYKQAIQQPSLFAKYD